MNLLLPDGGPVDRLLAWMRVVLHPFGLAPVPDRHPLP